MARALGRYIPEPPHPRRLRGENAERDARGERVVARTSVARLRALQCGLRASTAPTPDDGVRTYLDQNRLTTECDRRFHAADLELAGGVVQVVPAVVERLTPLVAVGA